MSQPKGRKSNVLTNNELVTYLRLLGINSYKTVYSAPSTVRQFNKRKI
jgi:hypothetical protein